MAENRRVIDRDEIDAMSGQLGVNASVIQRDYLNGWLLAGLFDSSPLLRDRLVLKGGNALRKAYFPETRLSTDLDFAAPTGLNPGLLLDALNGSCRLIQARTGVQFDIDRNAQVDQRMITNEQTVYAFSLYFRDFYGKASKMTLKLSIDVTEFGRIHLPIHQRKLIHPYSDAADCAATIEVVSLEEALADKLKCLLQRHQSHDLFDLVYAIFVNDAIPVDKKEIVSTFLRKTIFGPSPLAALRLLLAVPFEIMRGFWSRIVCRRPGQLDFTDAVARFKQELPPLFASFPEGAANQLAFFPPELRTPIMDAGRTKTLLRLTYQGFERLVEPYSLRFKWLQGGRGREYLYVWDRTGGRSGKQCIKSMLNGEITALENTDIAFEPPLRDRGREGRRVRRPDDVHPSPIASSRDAAARRSNVIGRQRSRSHESKTRRPSGRTSNAATERRPHGPGP